ncbi:hypothetical protein IAU60_000266 [Kwoniella sp. DSM 27419]
MHRGSFISVAIQRQAHRYLHRSTTACRGAYAIMASAVDMEMYINPDLLDEELNLSVHSSLAASPPDESFYDSEVEMADLVNSTEMELPVTTTDPTPSASSSGKKKNKDGGVKTATAQSSAKKSKEAAQEPPSWVPKGKRWVLVSDDDDQPRAKKTRKSRRGTGKKGKGKGNHEDSDDDRGDDEANGTEKGKKAFVARAAVWKDLPKWKDKRSPLLELPREILDLCFGLSVDVGLSWRDYLALAGTSRYFRQRFTDSVFRDVLNAKGVYIERPGEERWPSSNHSSHIFSREMEDWRQRPVREYGPTYLPVHWMPRELRTNWSEAQYIVYKEEQAYFREKRRILVQKEQIERERKAEDLREKNKHEFKISIATNLFKRRPIATVQGLLSGMAPAERDENGIPAGAELAAVAPTPDPKVKYSRSSNKFPQANTRPASRSEAGSSSNPTTDDSQSAGISRKVKERIAKRVEKAKEDGRIWKAPDSEYETEDEGLDEVWHRGDAELELEGILWPSPHREKIKELAHQERINKTEAISTYKVTAAELLCLKHVLVPNPMNKAAFRQSAVEALAYRSHGGPYKHKEFVRRATEKIAKGMQTRRDRIAKAKADGTYVSKKKKHRIHPYQWGDRDSHMAECEDSDCECADLR